MYNADNDNIHNICQILTDDCRGDIARLLARLHACGPELPDIVRETLIGPIIGLDSNLKALNRWLGMACDPARAWADDPDDQEDADGPPPIAVGQNEGLREGGAAVTPPEGGPGGGPGAPPHSDPGTRRTGQRLRPPPAIAVHPPPPGWSPQADPVTDRRS